MDYERQVEEIVNYFKRNEKKEEDYKLGVEFEHFVIDLDSLKTISYYGKDGVAESLKDLEKIGYKAEYEGEYILGLKKDKKTVTLEPGSQFELSIDANMNIKELEEEYLDFLEDIIPILESKNQGLLAVGYHPETKIDEIKLLPKKRYDYMFDYFKTKGTHAHNMMKGTSALQVSLDFSSEEDYNRKFRVGNALSPVLYGLFENSYYFEGEPAKYHNMRSYIWVHCDKDRSGVADGGLDKDFSYRQYAEYILNNSPIFIMKDGEAVYAKNDRVRDIFDPDNYTIEELEHILTMYFPDVRTKNFVEIRMMDSIPYPLNYSVIAMIKGIFYNQDNLLELEEYTKNITEEEVDRVKEEMMTKGLETVYNGVSLLEFGKYIVELSKKGLSKEEQEYLLPLEKMVKEGKNPFEITKDRAGKGSKKESLDWCLLNNLVEVK